MPVNPEIPPFIIHHLIKVVCTKGYLMIDRNTFWSIVEANKSGEWTKSGIKWLIEIFCYEKNIARLKAGKRAFDYTKRPKV